jgi:hypothetical protein
MKRACREKNVREIYTMYSHSFVVLSDRFFKGSTWPPVSAIAHLVDGDHIFCLLYKEMYFRCAGACSCEGWAGVGVSCVCPLPFHLHLSIGTC